MTHLKINWRYIRMMCNGHLAYLSGYESFTMELTFLVSSIVPATWLGLNQGWSQLKFRYKIESTNFGHFLQIWTKPNDFLSLLAWEIKKKKKEFKCKNNPPWTYDSISGIQLSLSVARFFPLSVTVQNFWQSIQVLFVSSTVNLTAYYTQKIEGIRLLELLSSIARSLSSPILHSVLSWRFIKILFRNSKVYPYDSAVLWVLKMFAVINHKQDQYRTLSFLPESSLCPFMSNLTPHPQALPTTHLFSVLLVLYF